MEYLVHLHGSREAIAMIRLYNNLVQIMPINIKRMTALEESYFLCYGFIAEISHAFGFNFEPNKLEKITTELFKNVSLQFHQYSILDYKDILNRQEPKEAYPDVKEMDLDYFNRWIKTIEYK